MTTEAELQTYVLNWGKAHRGERIQRVPFSYLSWMVNERRGPWQIAQAEIERRGVSVPDVEVSHHAIDTASLRIRRTWHEHRQKTEGLHAWLMRATKEALEHGELIEDEGHTKSIAYLGVKWVVKIGASWPVLKTVSPRRTKESQP